MTFLFIQIVCYIVLTIPQLANLTYSTVSSTIPNRSVDRLAIDRMIAFLAELMIYIFPVTSFYLYTLSSSTFRSELVKILRFIPFPCRKRSNSRIEPVIDTTVAAAAVSCHVRHQQTTLHASGGLTLKKHNPNAVVTLELHL